jgi:hypothetical protein
MPSLSLPSGIHMPVNSILPMVGSYDSSNLYNVDINTFDYCILYILLVVPLFLLFCSGRGYTNQIFQFHIMDSPLPYVNYTYLVLQLR